jgi:hypothetical protein
MLKNPQFLAAMGLYALLAFAAWRTLDEEFLWVTWIILGIFALKTVVHVLKRRYD